jgi:hypothetical protein
MQTVATILVVFFTLFVRNPHWFNADLDKKLKDIDASVVRNPHWFNADVKDEDYERWSRWGSQSTLVQCRHEVRNCFADYGYGFAIHTGSMQTP